MKRYSVQITDTALADMEEIENYISIQLQNPIAAAEQYDRVADEILKLNTMPERYSIPLFVPCVELHLHRMLVDSYSVFFLVEDSQVIVTDVLYSASDLNKRLLERH